MVDPWTRESRGFGFVTMSTVEEADRCIKYLNRSVVEGRVITVEKVIHPFAFFFFANCCIQLISGHNTSTLYKNYGPIFY